MATPEPIWADSVARGVETQAINTALMILGPQYVLTPNTA